ncbi:MAG: phage tail protein, partial [Robiginitomaculum sp.]|nr:phage tail protein [Robiginitomaculum sp.]
MPQVVGFFALPGALTIFGVSVGSIFTAVAIGGSVLSLAKKPGKIGDRGRAIELSTDPNAPVGVAYGRTAVAGSMVFQDVTNQNQDLSIIIALSNAGPIDAIEEVRLDDAPVTVDWATGNVSGKYAGYMRFEKRLGNNTEAAYSLSGISSYWSATATGENVANVWWALGWKDDLWTTGIPSALFVVRGIKVYDPRKDSTAGGVGTHRITDPATWEWSQNPALCALHYLIGVSENGKRTFGLHVPTAALDLPAFAVAADRCDELVNGKPRFICGGMVHSTDDPEAVLDAFGAVMGGAVFQSGGLFTCLAGGPQTATITLTDDDLAGPLEVTSAPSWREVTNTVTVNFTDPNRDWRENTTAPITDAAFVAEDDGRELPDEINLLMCNDADAAHRLGRLWLTNNREARTYTARFKPVAWGLKPGMVCNFASAAYGLTEKVMVTNCTRNADGTVDLVLRTETDAKYTASDNFAQAMPQHQKVTRYDPQVVDTPSLTDWTLTPVFGADPTKTGIHVVGATPTTINRILRVENSVDGGLTWLLDRDIELDAAIDLIVPVAGAGKAVKIGLTYINAFGTRGTRFVADLTTAALPAPTGMTVAPIRIQGATGRDFGLEVTAADPADWRAETFEVEVQSTLSGLWNQPGGKSTAEARRVLTPRIGSNLTVDVRARYRQK